VAADLLTTWPLVFMHPSLACLQELAAPVSELAMGRVGLQFFLTDTDSGSGSSFDGGSQQQQPQQQAQQQQGASSSLPLVYRLSQDHPQEVCLRRV
jgi:hypothetical protein